MRLSSRQRPTRLRQRGASRRADFCSAGQRIAFARVEPSVSAILSTLAGFHGDGFDAGGRQGCQPSGTQLLPNKKHSLPGPGVR
jgi:hypothetical protein